MCLRIPTEHPVPSTGNWYRALLSPQATYWKIQLYKRWGKATWKGRNKFPVTELRWHKWLNVVLCLGWFILIRKWQAAPQKQCTNNYTVPIPKLVYSAVALVQPRTVPHTAVSHRCRRTTFLPQATLQVWKLSSKDSKQRFAPLTTYSHEHQVLHFPPKLFQLWFLCKLINSLILSATLENVTWKKFRGWENWNGKGGAQA